MEINMVLAKKIGNVCPYLGQEVGVGLLIPAFRRQKQMNLCEFETSLVYRVSSRTAKTTEIKPISKNRKRRTRRKEEEEGEKEEEEEKKKEEEEKK